MNRDGPGFIIDLFLLWVLFVLCFATADVLVASFGRPWGLFAAGGVALVLGFVGLLAYYRFFLDATPMLEGSDRARFVLVVFQVVIVTFVLGAWLLPPDPFTQVIAATAGVVVGVPLAYVLVYRRDKQRSTTAT